MSESSINVQTVLLFLPLTVIQLALMIAALVDLAKREKVTGGNKVVWALVIIFISIIGPIVYFVAGRKED